MHSPANFFVSPEQKEFHDGMVKLKKGESSQAKNEKPSEHSSMTNVKQKKRVDSSASSVSSLEEEEEEEGAVWNVEWNEWWNEVKQSQLLSQDEKEEVDMEDLVVEKDYEEVVVISDDDDGDEAIVIEEEQQQQNEEETRQTSRWVCEFKPSKKVDENNVNNVRRGNKID